MTARLRKTVDSSSAEGRATPRLALLRRSLASLGLVLMASIAACTSYTEIPIETPIQPKLDVSSFQRIFIAGFIAGANEDVDANMETVRLLRSQLRNKGVMRVIDADTLPLLEVAKQNAPAAAPDTNAPPAPDQQAVVPAAQQPEADSKAPVINDEKDLEQYQHVFANVAYWKRIGEEFQQPLIVTGAILFAPQQRSGFVQREQESYDPFGRRVVVPVRTYMERKGYVLRPTFIFIDGRTGETLHSETFREEILYNANQQTPALSSYFELMDRLLPAFLNTLSAQKIKGTRTLLK
jgi:hypothetical protein